MSRLTDGQVRVLRAHYSRDLCVCGHMRQQHYTAILGATGACGGCDCSAYAWQPTEGDVPRLY